MTKTATLSCCYASVATLFMASSFHGTDAFSHYDAFPTRKTTIKLESSSTMTDENDLQGEPMMTTTTTEVTNNSNPSMTQQTAFINNNNDVLQNCNYEGNWGFDPLKLAKNKESLTNYREAEMKHGRIAMLVREFFVLFKLLVMCSFCCWFFALLQCTFY